MGLSNSEIEVLSALMFALSIVLAVIAFISEIGWLSLYAGMGSLFIVVSHWDAKRFFKARVSRQRDRDAKERRDRQRNIAQ